MKKTIFRALAITGVLMCLAGFGCTQVTLSKGWGPGKRSINDETCKLTTKTMMDVCHALMSELKRLIAYETRGMPDFGQLDERMPLYQAQQL